LVDLHADAVCNVLEGAEDATSGKSWLTIRDEYYVGIQAIADSIEKTEQQRDELLEFIKNIRDDMKDGQVKACEQQIKRDAEIHTKLWNEELITECEANNDNHNT